MVVSALEHLLEMLLLDIDGAAYKGGMSAERHSDWVKGIID